jgi:DHA1 family bicyclomycin/chloramphenicol resistance-like MFS transporter
MSDSRTREFIVLCVLALTAVLSPVSMDMLTPSLPGMAATLQTSPQIVELTLYSFLIGYGVAPSIWGVMSDRLGRRPVMFIGMSIYLLSSVACALVHEPGTLVALRFIQGIGGGAGATVARAVVRDIYGAMGTTHGMARMISLMAIVPFLIPMLGGVLASTLSWQACFAAMSLMALASIAAFLYLVPETRPEIVDGENREHPSLIAIVTHPTFAEHAVSNMFCISILVLFGANFSFITANQFQFDSTSNGLVLALFNGAIALGTYLAGRLMSRWGTHRAIVGGAVACLLGWLGVVSVGTGESPVAATLAPFLMLSAGGCGIIMALCSGAALTPFTHRSGTASSLYLLIQSAGSCAISLAVGLALPKELVPIGLSMAACAGLAVASKALLHRPKQYELSGFSTE